MTEQELIGKRLAIARNRQCMKQIDLGSAIGVSDQTISNWEVGLRTPRADLLRKLCRELRCSADYLLGLSDEFDLHQDARSSIEEPAVAAAPEDYESALQ